MGVKLCKARPKGSAFSVVGVKNGCAVCKETVCVESVETMP